VDNNSKTMRLKAPLGWHSIACYMSSITDIVLTYAPRCLNRFHMLFTFPQSHHFYNQPPTGFPIYESFLPWSRFSGQKAKKWHFWHVLPCRCIFPKSYSWLCYSTPHGV